MRGVKHEGSKSSLVDGAATASADVDSLENKQITNSSELKSIHSLTHDVQFEPVRESPLNTLGNGDLSLADFDNKFAREELGMGSRSRLSDQLTALPNELQLLNLCPTQGH